MYQPQAGAGGDFDPVRFVRRPTAILRALQLLFAVIVFGVLSDEGKVKDGAGREHSVFNDKAGPLDYTIGTGVFAFLAALLFLFLELANELSPKLEPHRRKLVIADVVFASVMVVLWFAAFVYTADEHRQSRFKNSAGGVGIAFSLFSMVAWAGSAFFAIRAVRDPESMISLTDDGDYSGAADPGTAYAAFTDDSASAFDVDDY